MSFHCDIGNTVHRYSYDGWNVIEEEIFTDENENDILDGDEYITQRRNFIDTGMDNHIAMEQFWSDGTATMYYFITDKRGNIEALMDDTGTVIERYHHTVYGTETTVYNADYTVRDCQTDTCYFGNTHTFGWSGSTFEPETNLYWMRNRYYHPDMKRFINQDPIGIWGDANNLGNGFAYVAGMVVDHGDPTGLYSWEEFREDLSSAGSFLGKLKAVGKLIVSFFTRNLYFTKDEKVKVFGSAGKKSAPKPQTPESVAEEQAKKEKEEQEKEKNVSTEKKDMTSEGDKWIKAAAEAVKFIAGKIKKSTEEDPADDIMSEENHQGHYFMIYIEFSFYPSEPWDEGIDKVEQKYILTEVFKKLMRSKTKMQPEYIIDEDKTSNYFMKIRNPHYHAKDPMLIKYLGIEKDDTGRRFLIRNPLAPPPEEHYIFNNFAGEIFHSKYNPGNIDPVLE